MKAKTPRPNPPETIGQARTWMTVKGIYLDLGLCEGCAAQAAWGHQCGFSAAHPPCPTCLAVIADFPVEKPNGWRTKGGKASRNGEDSPNILLVNGDSTPVMDLEAMDPA